MTMIFPKLEKELWQQSSVTILESTDRQRYPEKKALMRVILKGNVSTQILFFYLETCFVYTFRGIWTSMSVWALLELKKNITILSKKYSASANKMCMNVIQTDFLVSFFPLIYCLCLCEQWTCEKVTGARGCTGSCSCINIQRDKSRNMVFTCGPQLYKISKM